MKRKRTPQEKKQLSLTKDCRNSYDENAKSSRKNIPRARARKQRKYRRAVRQAIAVELGQKADADLLQDAAQTIRRDQGKKFPDIPLKEMIERKAARRRHTGQNPR